eukprot:361382-Chlamydomonas_euryale.AAC.2
MSKGECLPACLPACMYGGACMHVRMYLNWKDPLLLPCCPVLPFSCGKDPLLLPCCPILPFSCGKDPLLLPCCPVSPFSCGKDPLLLDCMPAARVDQSCQGLRRIGGGSAAQRRMLLRRGGVLTPHSSLLTSLHLLGLLQCLLRRWPLAAESRLSDAATDAPDRLPSDLVEVRRAFFHEFAQLPGVCPFARSLPFCQKCALSLSKRAHCVTPGCGYVRGALACGLGVGAYARSHFARLGRDAPTFMHWLVRAPSRPPPMACWTC